MKDIQLKWEKLDSDRFGIERLVFNLTYTKDDGTSHNAELTTQMFTEDPDFYILDGISRIATDLAHSFKEMS